MKKYITTDKHPELKEGIVIEETVYDSELFHLNTCLVKLPLEADQSIEYWAEKGYIKEVEEKEFTKSDMINFANWPNYSQIRSDQENLDNWLKTR